MKPSDLPMLWREIATAHNVDPNRLSFYESAAALTVAAIKFGMLSDTKYGDKVHAVCVQTDEIPGGPDFQILLRYPLHAHLRADTLERLKKSGFSEADCTRVCSSDQTIATFILLHEIAHHKLKHAPAQGSGTKELEADTWAISRMKA